MTKDNDELMPCPFCGGVAEMFIYAGEKYPYKVCCLGSPDAPFKSDYGYTYKCIVSPSTESFNNKNSAIKAWNTRPAPTQPSADVETKPANLYTSEKHVKENDNSLYVGADMTSLQALNSIEESMSQFVKKGLISHEFIDWEWFNTVRADLSQPKGDVIEITEGNGHKWDPVAAEEYYSQNTTEKDRVMKQMAEALRWAKPYVARIRDTQKIDDTIVQYAKLGGE